MPFFAVHFFRCASSGTTMPTMQDCERKWRRYVESNSLEIITLLRSLSGNPHTEEQNEYEQAKTKDLYSWDHR
jgi:hypothetical protein